jgi:hypothetical protein
VNEEVLRNEGITSWVKRVIKRGEIYRFEIVENQKDGTSSELIMLAYPNKKLIGILPKDKVYWYLEEDYLSQAAFTTLVGVDSYYLTKAAMNEQTRFKYVSEEVYEGHQCLKIQLQNDKLLGMDIGLQAMWLANGPLYFYVANDLNNLIVRATATNEDGIEEDFYVLKNISFKEIDFPQILFEIPSGFKELKEVK